MISCISIVPCRSESIRGLQGIELGSYMGKNEERKVFQVMIWCPNTGKAIPTGILAMNSTFEAQDYIHMQVTCPECAEVHTWSKKDAFLK